MAVGDIALKKLFQGLLSTAVAAKYTTPTGKQAQILSIWLDNQNTTLGRKVALYAHGTASTNRLMNNIIINPLTGEVISDINIILNAGEVLALSQDLGTDVNCTIYGIEEEV